MAKAESSENTNIIRNMIISVSTTVLGAAIIYLLGFNNKKPSFSKLEIQEATINAWRTYVTVENIYSKNGASLLRDRVNLKIELEDFLTESQKESLTFKGSLAELIKTEGIDKDLVSMFNRRLSNEDIMLDRWNKVIKRLKDFESAAWYEQMTEKQKTDTVMAEDKKFVEQSKGLMDRALTDIEDLSKTLSERYEQPFSMDDFLIIQVYKYKKDIFKLTDGQSPGDNPPSGTPGESSNDKPPAVTKEYLTGDWNSNGSTMKLSADGKCSWENSASKLTMKGIWQVKNGRLDMKLVNQQTKQKLDWLLELSSVTQNSFNFRLAGDNSNPVYTMVRI